MDEDHMVSRDQSPSVSGVREPGLSLPERLALFAEAMLEAWSDGDGQDGGDIQDVALRLGLLTDTVFNSEIHTDELGVSVKDGDPWLVYSADLVRAMRHAKLAQMAIKAATASPAERSVLARDEEQI